MTLVEALTLVGLLVGPITAVVIAEVMQRRRQAHERRETLMRQLLVSRAFPADPAYQMAVNMIPVEFKSYEGVKSTWDTYIETANKAGAAPEGTEKEHLSRATMEKQLELIKQVMIAMKYKEREAGLILRSGYVTSGFLNRDALVEAALRGLASLPAHLDRSANAAEATLRFLQDGRDAGESK